MAPNTESPHSSASSYVHTPDTRATVFSPASQGTKDTPAGLTTPQKSAPEIDPFISEKKPKGLSAGAQSFAPKVSLPNTYEHVLAIAAASGLGRDVLEPEISYSGTFTANSVKSRVLRVTSSSGRDVMQAIDSIFKDLELRGRKRIVSAGNKVLIQLDSFEDVDAVHEALKRAGDLLSEFINPRDFHQIVSPQDGGLYSSHEGEIVLRVSYSAMPHLSKLQFGEQMVAIARSIGDVCAWKRLHDPGYLHLVVEFSNISSVSHAITRLNGYLVGDSNCALEVTRNEPDLISNAAVARFQLPAPAPVQTPTRKGEAYDISTAFGSLNTGMNQGLSPAQIGQMSQMGQLSQIGQMNQMSQMGQMGQLASMSGFTPFLMMSPAYGQQSGQFYPTAVPMSAFAQMQPGFAYSPQSPQYNNMQFGGSPDHRRGNDYSPGANRDGTLQRRLQNRALTPGRNNRSSAAMNNHHNVVEIYRITNGSDVRTTVMLRNIPNKVDQAMLKAIIDESSFGRYDFLYLRIDFSNNCNVGYAFINFVDPLDIVQFVETRANKPWDSFKSDKIAEVSYATIQGRDCLIQKFRNSSVMLEPPHYRPKLFITYNDPPELGPVGQEDEFPSSDNASKLKRSCENAEHVGLFAPSAGQHMRDEQRRRRSQYDRGTSLAAQEEFDYDPFVGYPHSPY